MRNCTRLREQTRSWPEQARRRHDCVEQFRRVEIEIEAGGRFIVNSLQSNADCWVRALRLGVDFGTKLNANVVELGEVPTTAEFVRATCHRIARVLACSRLGIFVSGTHARTTGAILH